MLTAIWLRSVSTSRLAANAPAAFRRRYRAIFSVFRVLGLAVMLAGLLLASAAQASAKEVIPPAPANYFNDYAGVVRPEVARQLNSELEAFEKATSNQILVAVYPKMQTDSSIEDYTVRVAQAWRVGQKGRNNGAVLFVFTGDRKMFIQVGYGLEGALTDFLCRSIIENEIKPRFKAGDYTGGLKAGVAAMLAAAKGEYKGTGRTVKEGQRGQSGTNETNGTGWLAILLFFLIIWIISRFFGGPWNGSGYSGRGRGPIFYGGGGGGFGGGGGGGGGGGFSGGGGSFGGGGAGGDW